MILHQLACLALALPANAGTAPVPSPPVSCGKPIAEQQGRSDSAGSACRLVLLVHPRDDELNRIEQRFEAELRLTLDGIEVLELPREGRALRGSVIEQLPRMGNLIRERGALALAWLEVAKPRLVLHLVSTTRSGSVLRQLQAALGPGGEAELAVALRDQMVSSFILMASPESPSQEADAQPSDVAIASPPMAVEARATDPWLAGPSLAVRGPAVATKGPALTAALRLDVVVAEIDRCRTSTFAEATAGPKGHQGEYDVMGFGGALGLQLGCSWPIAWTPGFWGGIFADAGGELSRLTVSRGDEHKAFDTPSVLAGAGLSLQRAPLQVNVGARLHSRPLSLDDEQRHNVIMTPWLEWVVSVGWLIARAESH